LSRGPFAVLNDLREIVILPCTGLPVTQAFFDNKNVMGINT
jgi:hypothetical protein